MSDRHRDGRGGLSRYKRGPVAATAARASCERVGLAVGLPGRARRGDRLRLSRLLDGGHLAQVDAGGLPRAAGLVAGAVPLGQLPRGAGNFPFLHYAANTLRIALPVVVGTTISSALVAYGFSRLRWPGREIVFYLVLATLMIPNWVTLVPLYILFNRPGLGRYLPAADRAELVRRPFSIFLLRQFFLRQPQDLVDAARVDGASHLRIFAQIIVPLARPALAVVALFAFINGWTDFFNPLIYLTNPDKHTLQLGLFTFFSQHFVNWPGFMAASSSSCSPSPSSSSSPRKHSSRASPSPAYAGDGSVEQSSRSR